MLLPSCFRHKQTKYHPCPVKQINNPDRTLLGYWRSEVSLFDQPELSVSGDTDIKELLMDTIDILKGSHLREAWPDEIAELDQLKLTAETAADLDNINFAIARVLLPSSDEAKVVPKTDTREEKLKLLERGNAHERLLHVSLLLKKMLLE